MSDTSPDPKPPEHVTADYCDESGNLLWAEDPYPFKRMFAVGQTTYRERKSYAVVSKKFDGAFGNGKITYVVRKL